MLSGALLAACLAQSDVRPFEEAEAMFAQIPPKQVRPSQAWVSGWDKDPRTELARLRAADTAWRPDPAVEQQLERLSKDLEAKPPSSGSDPRVKRIAELAAKLSPPGEREFQAALAKQDRYDQETRRWVKSSGYEAIASWKGKMALLLETPASGNRPRTESATVVEWTAPNRFWGSAAGRLLWTGGYTVRCEIRAEGKSLLPARQVVREGKNFAQMHLGREGWYVKFTPVGVEAGGQRFFVPLPTLSNLLLNGHLLESVQTAADVGDLIAGADRQLIPGAALLGYPSDLGSRGQSGRVGGSLATGGRFRVAWQFGPG